MTINDVRWTYSGQCLINDYQIDYPGNTNDKQIGTCSSCNSKYKYLRECFLSRKFLSEKNKYHSSDAAAADKSDELIETFFDGLTTSRQNFTKTV